MNSDLELARAVRELVLAAERFRVRWARDILGVGGTELITLGTVLLEGPQTPSQLAARAGITTASATELLDRLTQVGLVQRAPHPNDRRKVLVSLTPRASTAVRKIYRRLDDVLANATSLDATSRGVVVGFLQDAATALQATAGEPAPPLARRRARLKPAPSAADGAGTSASEGST